VKQTFVNNKKETDGRLTHVHPQQACPMPH